MIGDLFFREQLAKVSQWIVEELDRWSGEISSTWAAQHTDTGGHGAITATSIASGLYTFPLKDATTASLVAQHSRLIASSAADVNGPTGGGLMLVVRDASNGGTALVIHDNATTPVIVSQIGTTFVVAAPAAGEIQIKSRTGGVAFLAGATRNGDVLYVSAINSQPF